MLPKRPTSTKARKANNGSDEAIIFSFPKGYIKKQSFPITKLEGDHASLLD
jgi:hypothetical protein